MAWAEDMQERRFEERVGPLTVSGRRVAGSPGNTRPLIVALHGGTYTSGYFDVPGYSLLNLAAAVGAPVIALDRPGYEGTTAFAPADATIANNAERLEHLIGELWRRDGADCPGIVLIGHSIGGAIATTIAAAGPSWPMLGLAISGVGLETARESGPAWAALPALPTIQLPGPVKDMLMFGPEWTFAADMPELGHTADAPVPRAELIDIVTTWPTNARQIIAKVKVPVHSRQGEFDRLWIVDDRQVADFGAGFVASSDVDAAIFANAGHCIDFHKLGPAFQLEQLGFALRCCVRRPQ